MGMDEAKNMITDAEHRENQYGIGLGHYSLGLVYAMMRNNAEAANAYQKSINILMRINPKPLQLAEIFSYYSEVLDILVERQENIEQLTKQISSVSGAIVELQTPLLNLLENASIALKTFAVK